MQLKFSKKSFIRDRHSLFGGSRLKMRRWKRSPNTSGFQYIHLFSSTDAEDIISWNEESPVFSLTHWIPLGEKIENPDEDPTMMLAIFLHVLHSYISEPMYRVSPQLLVTNEHIMSDSASTSSSFPSGEPLLRFSAFLSPFLLCGSGDAKLRGVDSFSSLGEVCDDEVGFDPGCCDKRIDSLLVSASRFSNVPKSVRPLSSSVRRPKIYKLSIPEAHGVGPAVS